MKIKPSHIRLEAATVCQLRCPSCPTTAGAIGRQIGAGFLRYEDFKKIVDENPWIADIELSNWGEIFLNPDLLNIMRYAHEHHVRLSAENGVNFNTVRDDMLEALVRYRVHRITCSIDGASQETYALYRKQGRFDDVIEHIKRLNHYKAQYRSTFPMLRWQFVVFGHNEREIPIARDMAKRLGMSFWPKLSWDDTFSPVRDEEFVRRETGLGVASRAEFHATYGESYLGKQQCAQLWKQPQINWDGRVLGCCVNYLGDFGNAFKEGVLNSVNNEKMRYARQMLLGTQESRTDIPCSICVHYRDMKARRAWLRRSDVIERHRGGRFRVSMQRALDGMYRRIVSLVKRRRVRP